MNPSWITNVVSRSREFAAQYRLDLRDRQALARFAQRIHIDPYDIWAERDSTGEWQGFVGESTTHPGFEMWAGYIVYDSRRQVNVISFFFLHRGG